MFRTSHMHSIYTGPFWAVDLISFARQVLLSSDFHTASKVRLDSWAIDPARHGVESVMFTFVLEVHMGAPGGAGRRHVLSPDGETK
jgi:hypothetical protein